MTEYLRVEAAGLPIIHTVEHRVAALAMAEAVEKTVGVLSQRWDSGAPHDRGSLQSRDRWARESTMKVLEPDQVARTYTQRIEAPPEVVFPLYCPVREADWVPGWDPIAVYSRSGVVEPDCIFVTKEQDGEVVWVVTLHDPSAFHVEMLKVTPGCTLCKLTVQLTRVAGDETDAQITYCHTAIGPEGESVVEQFTETVYEQFMRRWEATMNHYIRTGKCLAPGERAAQPGDESDQP